MWCQHMRRYPPGVACGRTGHRWSCASCATDVGVATMVTAGAFNFVSRLWLAGWSHLGPNRCRSCAGGVWGHVRGWCAHCFDRGAKAPGRWATPVLDNTHPRESLCLDRAILRGCQVLPPGGLIYLVVLVIHTRCIQLTLCVTVSCING